MDENSSNQNNYDDRILSGMRKITYWEIYGIKRFPYRGRRRYTPLLSQSSDGGMIISNDVFGLTIRQFERMYKVCLNRRKTHEQWILNLRYPDKSSNDYLEYLQNCTDCNKDHLLWLANDPREKLLYQHLVKTVGTEIDIRIRQRLFIIQDMIINACSMYRSQIASGSLAEGLDLPGSDIDRMHVIRNIDVIQNENNIKQPIHRTTVVMESDIDHPGFTRLRLIARGHGISFHVQCHCCPGQCTGKKLYLSVNRFLDSYRQLHRNVFDESVGVHGPCISDQGQTVDVAYCLRSKYLPHNAIPSASRHRWQWPPNFVIDRITNSGCLLVPIGPKTISDSDVLWRLSFSVAEKILVHSFNFTQLLCYGLLKLTLKRIVNTNNDVKELMCSYFLKTALFWVSEEGDIDTFQLPTLYCCFSLCLDKLISWVNICYCPNYFIPEHNMFLGKINQSNNKKLILVLESIKCGGIDELITNLFSLDNKNRGLLSSQSDFSSTKLDFLLYRITRPITSSPDISNCFKGLSFTESLLKSESSTFIIDVCKYNYAKISQNIAQLLPSPHVGKAYNIRKCYHRHLQEGINADAVSGWLLYASFYYVIGQYNVALSVADYVLPKFTPNMVLLKCVFYDREEIDYYRQNVHSAMTLKEKIKSATVGYIWYMKHSSLIPKELQLEVEDTDISIPPVVMSHCLRFLCYHHLDDIFNRQQALRELHNTIKYRYFIARNSLSCALTILGVCYEISGDKDIAYKCYDQAVCSNEKCHTAEKRRCKLFETLYNLHR